MFSSTKDWLSNFIPGSLVPFGETDPDSIESSSTDALPMPTAEQLTQMLTSNTPNNKSLFSIKEDKEGSTSKLTLQNDSHVKPSKRICIAFDLDNGLFDFIPGMKAITGFDEPRWKAFTNAIKELAKKRNKKCTFIGLTNNAENIASHRLNSLLPIPQKAEYKLTPYEKIRKGKAKKYGSIVLLPRGMSKTDALVDLERNHDDLCSHHVYLFSTPGLGNDREDISDEFKFLPYNFPINCNENNFYNVLANIEQSVIDWMLHSLNFIRDNLGLNDRQHSLHDLIGVENYYAICAKDSFRNIVKLNSNFHRRHEAIASANSELRKLFCTLNTEQLKLSAQNKTDHALNQKVKALDELTQLCSAKLYRLQPLLMDNLRNEAEKLALLQHEFGSANKQFKQAASNCLIATRLNRDYTTMAVNLLIGTIAFFATGVIPGIIYFITQGRLWQPIDPRSYKESSERLNQIGIQADTPLKGAASTDDIANGFASQTLGTAMRNI